MELEKLKSIIADVLNMDPEEIDISASFTDDLGADSLDIYQIIMGIEDEFGVEIDQDAIGTIKTVEDAARQIKDAIG